MPPPNEIKQASRALEIITPLGPDILGLRSIHVREQLSGGFTIEAEMSSADPDINFDQIVGHPVGVRLSLQDGTMRYWHALVARFMYVETTGAFYHYRATLVPWLWALTRSADCRIFQDKKRSEIVQEVLRDRGANDFELRLSGSYLPEEYCVQYRETDFNFVSRLLEQEGIAYYFKHDENLGKLIMADEKAAYDHAPVAELLYRPTGEKDDRIDNVHAWEVEHEVQATQYALSDYNPLKPKESLLRTAKVDRSYGLNDRQLFDYPGEYNKPGEAERISRIRLDEVQAASEVIHARTTCRALGAGHLFALKDHPRADQNREYLVTFIELHFDAGEFSGTDQPKPKVSCAFTAIPSSQTYRPPRLTPRPTIHGLQPAVVVGPSGEEIYTDENGRVKVHFFWDRHGKADEKSSCWLRVAQGWAGKKWGALYLPRIGHEVLVSFLEGDPDRPVVTGSVYNGENTPPYPLPAEKTKSTLKSLSSKGGGGFNEIRLEDKKGEEQIFVHAEKDTDTRIKNDAYEWIGHDTHLIVKNDQVEEIGNDRHEKIKRDHVEEVDRDHHLTVKGKEAIAVTGSHSFKVTGDVIEVYGANQSTQVTKDLYIKAANIVIEATTNITINVGDSFIAIEASGIKIGTNGDIVLDAKKNINQKATMDVKIEATANASMKGTAGLKLESPANAEMKSAATTVKGDGMLTLKGGMVQIN
ncbi:MAG TPA: type VI secretion system tip protein TssI/VgrG [Lacunisphaera sp.]|nr:type VI secretion system tip protein TssI/VgrG [Lacunisphaera sp.]